MKQYNKRLFADERILRIPMPWTGRYYSYNTDTIRRGRRRLVIAWSFSSITGFHFRAGWSFP